ncbi:MAG TPA: hypothetical protein VFR18_23395 [Terriglobia bacterium]|nr:hypothetical protein [Terriglobia bacterium]
MPKNTFRAMGTVVLPATAILLAVATVAFAKDRELQALLQSLTCVPDRVVSNRLSPTLVVYEVTCKQSGGVVQVECLETKCRRLIPTRDDEKEQ